MFKIVLEHKHSTWRVANMQVSNVSNCLGLNSEFAGGEMDVLFVLSESFPCAFMLGQPSSDRTSLLGTKVKREVILALVELSEVLSLLLVGDSQDTGYRLADGMNSCKLSSRTTSDLLDPESQQLLL